MKARFNYVLKYSEVFDEQPLELPEYLKNVPKDVLLGVASQLLGYFNKNSKYSGYVNFLTNFFSNENRESYHFVYDKIQKVQRKLPGLNIVIATPLASLTLFNFMYNELQERDLVEDSEFNNVTFEINMLKLYLLVNEEWMNKETEGLKFLSNLPEPLKTKKSYLITTLLNNEFNNYDVLGVYICQLYKANVLFDFISTNDKTVFIFEELLAIFKFQNKSDFFKYYLPITNAILLREEGSMKISVPNDDDFDKSCNFIDNFILISSEAEDDFISIRDKPLYKLAAGEYQTIFPLFILEKIYKSWYFVLNKINTDLPRAKKAESNFRSFYGDKFSEEYLVNSILERCFSFKCKKISGQFIRSNFSLISEPDYYIRDWNNIFLFESKDTLIKADVKSSYSISAIEEELTKKLYYYYKANGDIANKAILQLLNNVKRISNVEVEYDDLVNLKPTIYPVILVHDESFNAIGLNDLINEWFQVELQKMSEEGFHISRVKPITIITLDTLILYGDLIAKKKIKLNKMIDEYAKKYLSNSQVAGLVIPPVSFAHFAMAYVKSLKLPMYPDDNSIMSVLNSVTGYSDNLD